MSLRLDTATAFPERWVQPERKADFAKDPLRFHRAFLRPGAVSVAALRLGVQDTMAIYGQRYPRGQQYLRQLDRLEKARSAAEGRPAEDQQKVEDALAELCGRAMLAHPLLDFDKLLFLKRPAGSRFSASPR